jgi:hypothetical protein
MGASKAEGAAAITGLVLVLLMLLPYAASFRGWILYAYWITVALASYVAAWITTGVWGRGGEA